VNLRPARTSNVISGQRPRRADGHADTLQDPQILDKGQIRRFDRVLANPPFSQNYSRATLKF